MEATAQEEKVPVVYWNYNVAFGLMTSLKLRCPPNMSSSLSLSHQICLLSPSYSFLPFYFMVDTSFTSQPDQTSLISHVPITSKGNQLSLTPVTLLAFQDEISQSQKFFKIWEYPIDWYASKNGKCFKNSFIKERAGRENVSLLCSRWSLKSLPGWV